MSLVYNEEQQQLDDSAREFLAARSGVGEQRRLRDDKVPAGFSTDVWQEMLALGWGGIALPEEYGGLDFGFQGFAPVFDQIGRNLSASPLLSSVVLCASVIEQLGRAEQRETMLPALISGDQRLALALHAQDRFRAEDVGVSVQADGDSYLLSGNNIWVPDGVQADGWLVAGRLANGDVAVFHVPAGTTAVTVKPLQVLDSRNHARLSFDQVRVPGSARIGDGNDACQALELAVDRGTACVAAELLGTAEAMFAMTLEYLKTRTQFGVAIGSFQALQHRVSWLYVDLQLARSAVMGAFEALDSGTVSETERQQLVSLAKWKAGEAAHKISAEAVQMHGGIGVTDEYDLGLYLKRVRVAQVMLGDSDFHCERYGRMARQLSGEVAP
ncbi:acyl-CoA dehydrogenase family protein [Marinobacter sp. X15-166B]|uniref:acyl-CoA dehydrogenase family protein n=1 Tax=Marinobacter sp. X15-166B TaxID=1897620 RepID=UPI00085CB4C0|nr:acyl-CoA dehydrogenase family protein [Marinobacter sp. X15-166B]OEY66306.1 acyl-CoA dehydrogenase [Marinobacter sp. X15-166B]